MTAEPTATFTVQPFAAVPVDHDAGDLIGAVLTALEHDPRAHGPVCAYDYSTGRVDAIFQVDLPEPQTKTATTIDHAAGIAVDAFNNALRSAGFDAHTAGVSVVEGDDPDQLP